MSDEFTPLDPQEGPTIWVTDVEDNKHLVKLVSGCDPNDPIREFRMTRNEIKRLYQETDFER